MYNAVARRAFLDASICLLGVATSRPARGTTEDATAKQIERLAAAVRGPGDAGLSAWGQPWSNGCAWSAPAAPLEREAVLPPWLEGQWKVSSRLESVRFPMGKQLLSESTPGVRMVSILQLPNIGNEPTFALSFRVDADGAVRADRAANSKTVLEAFWADARVLETTSAKGGRLLLRYESPTKTRKNVQQTVDVRLCSSEGGPVAPPQGHATAPKPLLRPDLTVGELLLRARGDGDSGQPPGEWIVAEVYQQENVEQGTRSEYLVLTAYRRADTTDAIPRTVLSKQRVAAFLLPTDGAYFESLGKPVALYDYSYLMTRVSH